MDYLMKQYIFHFLLRIYDLTLFFIYHYVLNSPSKIMQFRYRTSQTAYSKFYYNLKMSFKEEFFFILSLIICPSPPTYEKKFVNLCLYFYIYRNHRWLF